MSYRAVVSIRVGLDLDAEPVSREKLDEAEEALRVASRSGDRAEIVKARKAYASAERKHDAERKKIAKDAEVAAESLVHETLAGRVTLLGHSIEVVEEIS